jgi:hypothetical protein
MSRIVILFILVSMALAACGSPSPAATEPGVLATAEHTPLQHEASPTPVPVEPSPTVTDARPTSRPQPSPTPTAPLVQGIATETPGPILPGGGHVEVRTPNTINMQGECVNTIPFVLVKEGGRTLSRGEGQIVCEFEGKPVGGEEQPIVYHVILEFEAVLDGELLPPTVDRPHGWLDAYLNLDGAIVQYYTGYPPQAINPCPESQPCRTPTSEVIPLPFVFEEGSTITVPWTFILHLL